MERNRLIIAALVFLCSCLLISQFIDWPTSPPTAKTMEPDNFYLHLSSQVKKTRHTEGKYTIGSYVTTLPRRINLNENWEVGLSDISYTKSWYNILEYQALYLVDNENHRTTIPMVLPAGNYQIDEVVELINAIYRDHYKSDPNLGKPPILKYNKHSNKIVIQLGIRNNTSSPYLYPNFSPFLADFLGLCDENGEQYPKIASPDDANIINSTYFLNKDEDDNDPIHVVNIENWISSTPPAKPPKVVTKIANPLPSTRDSNTQKITTKIIESQKSAPGIVKLPPEDDVSTGSVEGGVKPDEHTISKRDTKKKTSSTASDKLVFGLREVSLHGTIRSLYVYCSIVKPVLVSNYEVPLIRRVEIPTDKKFGDTCELNYTSIQYYPLVSHEFDSIEIDIKDDQNNTIGFAFGRTELTLHFRKK